MNEREQIHNKGCTCLALARLSEQVGITRWVAGNASSRYSIIARDCVRHIVSPLWGSVNSSTGIWSILFFALSSSAISSVVLPTS